RRRDGHRDDGRPSCPGGRSHPGAEMTVPVPMPSMRQRLLPRLDPKAAVTVPSGTAAGGKFVTIDEILTAFEEDPREHKRLAVVFTGGGARGAYGGGAVEALIQAFRRRQVMPDVICGASVGAINALCLFGDLMFPLAAPDPQSALTTTQSLVWRQMGAGGNGADLGGGQAAV